MSTAHPSRIDLTDPEQRRVTFALVRKGRVLEIAVAPPCMAQLLAVIRLEPADAEAETHMQHAARDYNSALLLCLPPFPRAWWERLPWYIRRWQVGRFLEGLSYHRLALLINNLIALAQGVPVDVLTQMSANAAPMAPSEREAAINNIIAVVATEMKMPPQQVAELPAKDFAALADQVAKKLHREEEWRQLLAGTRRG